MPARRNTHRQPSDRGSEAPHTRAKVRALRLAGGFRGVRFSERQIPCSHDRLSMRSPKHLTAVAVLLFAGLVASCATNPSSTQGSTPDSNVLEQEGTPVPGGKLVVGIPADVTGWSNITSLWADVGNFMGSAVLEPLYQFDAEGVPQPWLAESITPATPGKFDQWTIKVRDGVTFHNGEKLDAEVVKQNFDLNNTESLAAVATKSLIEGSEVIDDRTVLIKLTQPWSAFPGFMANSAGLILAKESLAQPDRGGSHPIGTGPYSFVKWERDSYTQLKKNTNYWQKGKGPYADELEFKVITDNTARTQALRAGDLDMEFTHVPGQAANLANEFQVVTDYDSEKLLVMLNTLEDPTKRKNPLKDARVRKALALATDTNGIKQIVGDPDLQTTTALQVTKSRWKMDEAATGATKFNLDEAKKEIASYKQDTGEQTISFSLTSVANLDVQAMMQALVQQWKSIGVDATIDTTDEGTFISRVALGGYQAAIFRNYGYVDPDADYYFWHSSTAKGLGVASVNFTQWKDPEIDKALDGARATDDFNARKAFYETVTKQVNASNTNIWIYNTPYALVANRQTKGLNQARTRSFGNYLPKTWLWLDIWKQKS